MNKKGFTLIEIIIAITLITIISGTTIVTVSKINKDTKTSDIDKKIVDAASVFIENEKDENGNLYIEGINNGGKGIQLSVNNLYEKGYISEDTVKTLENKTNSNIKNLHILVSNSINTNNENECGSGLQEYTLSWNNSNKPIYLCPVENNTTIITNTEIIKEYIPTVSNVIKITNNNNYTGKIPVSKNTYEALINADSNNTNYVTDKENGIFEYTNMSSGYTYYFYRGAVDNNYVKLGKSNNKDLNWRIMWFRSDGSMKLVLDDILEMDETSVNTILTEKNIKNNKERFYNRTLYLEFLTKWFNNNTTLKNLNYISNNKLCLNYKYETYFDFGGDPEMIRCADYEGENYIMSNTFDCTEEYSYTNEPGGEYNSKIGFVTYGDAFMIGLGHSYNFSTSKITDPDKKLFKDNYLINLDNEGNIIEYNLGDINGYYNSISSCKVSYYYSRYVVNETGIAKKTITTIDGYNRKETYNYVNKIKPAIIINTNSIKFKDNTKGTKDNPYIIENA